MYKLNPLLIPKFFDEIRILPFFIPAIRIENNKIIYDYTAESCEFYQQILPKQFGFTKVWGFRGVCMDPVKNKVGYYTSSPGPSFFVQKNAEAGINWINNIKKPYMFPVDATLYWANPKQLKPSEYYIPYPYGDYKMQSPVPMVMHIHGGLVPPEYDGHPDAWYTANNLRGPMYQTNYYIISNKQEPSTLWYHDNTRGLSRLNVYSGLAGAYIIKDFEKDILGSDIEDIVLIIQDKSFYEDASLYYPLEGEDINEHPYWVSEFYGDVILVNGVSWPYMDVKSSFYRFRIINASNSRRYEICLSDNSGFTHIGTDGGYTEYPKKMNCCKLSPGERAEIIIDFGRYENGESVILKNNALDAVIGTTDTIMQFRVNKPIKNRKLIIPFKLNEIKKLEPVMGGELSTINQAVNPDGKTIGFYFNGQAVINPASEFNQTGDTFIWDLINLTGKTEAVHFHLIQFQILYRQQININAYSQEWKNINGIPPLSKPTVYLDPSSFFIGEPVNPEDYEIGWKDTVYLPQGYITRIILQYAPTYALNVMPGVNSFPFNPSYGGEYTLNSSILEHNDNEVSRPQFIIC